MSSIRLCALKCCLRSGFIVRISKILNAHDIAVLLDIKFILSNYIANNYDSIREFGAKLEPDLVKTLAYAYVSSDLRDGRYEDGFNNIDTRFAEAMQTELSPETLKQAKVLYLELMAKNIYC